MTMNLITENNLVEARYLNDERDQIECLINTETGVAAINVMVDPDQHLFRQLMAVCSLADIDNWTTEHYAVLREQVETYHRSLIEDGFVSYMRAEGPENNAAVMTEVANFLLRYDTTSADHIEKLFNLKLEIFELQAVIDADEDTKASIRESTDPLAIMNILHGIM